ncbi:MAG: Hpt domain-containing protein [Lachnospiraceae bacterium]|nr:Hpt domain-containing protein [Lachnospiraceae bacterium]
MMTLEECYSKFGGDYQDVMARLLNESMVSRLVVKFLDDPSYQNLSAALEEENYGDAFRAVHTLKGLSLNFSFGNLSNSSSDLTELLRHWETEPVDSGKCEEFFAKVREDYLAVTEALKEFAGK